MFTNNGSTHVPRLPTRRVSEPVATPLELLESERWGVEREIHPQPIASLMID